jgi:chemotaxis protein CheD
VTARSGGAARRGTPPVTRFLDPATGCMVVKVGPGEHHVTSEPNETISTVLGSCIAACIRDPVAGVGGLNHFMLPTSIDGVWGKASASLRYGNFAMERLINDILARGGMRSRFEIKLFGGARLGSDHGRIGERNARYVEAYLNAEGMAPVVRQMGGTRARRIVYHPIDGRACMLELPDATRRIVGAEARFGEALRRRLPAGDVVLFD